MPPVTRNKAPDSSSSTSGAPQSTAGTRATRSTSTKPPSTGTTTDTKSRSTTTSNAPPPKPAGGTLSRSTTNRVSVVLPKRSTITPGIVGGKEAKEKAEDKDDKEPIRAFLRIRPAPSSANSTPYITTLSETAVEMTDPAPAAPRFGMRPSLAPAPSTTYTFTRVFPPEALQPEFFASTALPLVKDLLNGENGLVFAYGVTNSGKTYTIQGGNGKGEGGLLPRTLDVLFNSIEGLHGENKWRPAKCSSVEREPIYGYSVKSKAGPTVEPDVESLMENDTFGKDDTVVQVDRNYEYSVFVSYAEIYNEKIFDLLATGSLSPEETQSTNMSRSNSTQSISRQSQAKPLPRYLSALLPKSFSSHLGFGSSSSISGMAGGGGTGGDIPGSITRKALALKSDPTTSGKYVSGLREIRVRSAQEGRAILKLGQINRTVFGTVANEQSSRSHAVFTIKVLKVHKGANKDDPEEVQCARLSVVDLAGSERSKNTHATGERLKEAGNINKSLMVLGQCMEMLRANQRKIATGGTLKLGVVPFRHSKLTELFMDFFVGEGRAVMIVNVNPYDTGFDENSHVMRFSALARDVATTTQRILPPRPPPAAKSSGMATGRMGQGLSASIGPGGTLATKDGRGSLGAAPTRTARKVRLSEGTPAETVLEVVEEDETYDDEDEEDIPRDTLVDELFEEVEYLRERLFEAEMRASVVEAEIREEVMKEMEERMQAMERMFMRRLASEVEAGETKTDRKIDMLQRAGLLQPRQEYDTEEEADVDKSLMVEEETEYGEEDYEDEDSRHPASPTPKHKQPLTGGPLTTLDEGRSFEEGPSVVDDEEGETTEDGDISGVTGDVSMSIENEESTEESEDEDEEEPVTKPKARTPHKQRIVSDDDEYEQDEDEEEEEEYVPPPPPKAKRNSIARTPGPSTKIKEKAPVGKAATPAWVKRESMSPVAIKQEDVDVGLDAGEDRNADESMTAAAIVPNKRVRAAHLAASGPGSTYIPSPGEPEAVKKKKRQLGKTAALTEDQIWQVAMKAEEQERNKGSMGVRRLGRGSR